MRLNGGLVSKGTRNYAKELTITAKDCELIIDHLCKEKDRDYGKYEFIVSYRAFCNNQWVIHNMIIRGDHVGDVREKFSRNKSLSLIKKIKRI